MLAQTFTDFEVIVADDGSTDGTDAAVAALADPRLRYLRLPRAGAPAPTRNAGVRASGGELVAFLDSDDVWKPEKLAQDVAFLDAHPEVAAVFSDLEKVDGARYVPSFMAETAVFARWRAALAPGQSVALDARRLYLCLLQEVPILPSAFTIRRAALERFGVFDEAWTTFEDWELFLRVARQAPIGYIDRPLATLRVQQTANHRARWRTGVLSMIGLLRAERARCGGDRAARAAMRAGIARLRRRLGWYELARGRRVAALGCYVHGFVETGAWEFPARAALLAVPPRLASRLRRVGRRRLPSSLETAAGRAE